MHSIDTDRIVRKWPNHTFHSYDDYFTLLNDCFTHHIIHKVNKSVAAICTAHMHKTLHEPFRSSAVEFIQFNLN